MSIISVEKMWSRNGGSASTTDGRDANINFTEAYQVVHTYDETVIGVLNAQGIPTKGSLYPGTYAICRSANVSQVSPIMSIVVVEWSGEAGPFGLGDTPINEEPEIEWTDSVSNEPIDTDVDGNPIVTVNGEPVSGVTMEIADPVLNVTRNFASFSPWLTHAYRHSVSSDVFAGFAAGTARLVAYSARNQRATNGFSYWKVAARVQFRLPYNTTADKAWHFRTVQKGYRVVVDGKISDALDDFQQPVKSPVLIQLDGTVATNPATAHFLEVKRYKPLPYSVLGLI